MLLLAVPEVDVSFYYLKNKKITTLDCDEEDEKFIEICNELELIWRNFAILISKYLMKFLKNFL